MYTATHRIPNVWVIHTQCPLITAHVEGSGREYLVQLQQVREGVCFNTRELVLIEIKVPVGKHTVTEYICICLYTSHALPHCPHCCTCREDRQSQMRLHTLADNIRTETRYIYVTLYSNDQHITLHVHRNVVTQGNTHVRGTHTQAMPP